MSNWNEKRSINKLQSIIDSDIQRYSYNLARYMNDVTVDLQYFTEYNDSIWNYRFYNIQDSDLAQSPKINVIKSVIDSLVSKLANQKVRVYMNPVNGLFTTRKITKQAQQYFDIIYDKMHVQEKISHAYRNACIFGIGYLFFNPITKDVETPGTWQVGICNTEKGYGTPTKCLIEYKNMPVTELDKYGIKGKYTSEYVNFKIFVDTLEKTIKTFVNGVEATKGKYNGECIPIIPVYHTRPVFGTRTVSVVDELDGIQTNIDLINQKISTAAQLTPGNVTYVSAGSSLTKEDISNRTGMAYTVKMGPGQNQLPVVNVTPAPFDPIWQSLLDSYVKQAYEIIGISQLSAQSQKPTGLDSGAALSTMEDIESDRFQTQVDNYVHAFVDLAKLIMEINEGDILPKSVDTADYSWEDIRKQKDLFKIQFSAASALSKDPATKIQQIMQLTQIGLITTDKVALYLDSPDLEEAYRGASAVQDAIDATISNAVEKDNYDIPDYVGYQQLLTQIIIEENKLYASKDTEAVMKLEKLKSKLLEIMNEEGFADLSNEQPQEIAPATEEGLSAGAAQDLTGAAAQAASYQFPAQDNNDQMASPTEAANPLEGDNNVQGMEEVSGNM